MNPVGGKENGHGNPQLKLKRKTPTEI